MPLAPDVAAMIEAARVPGARTIHDITLEEARNGYRLKYRERGLAVRDDVEVQALMVPSHGAALRARLYRPAAARANALPLIVYFHGGGFVLGDLDAYEAQSMHLAAATGCALLFAEFRLAPEAKFPTAVDDAIATTAWAASNAAALGVDPARIAVMGDSAGGNLAVNVALHARRHGSPALRAQCLLYPVTDFRPFRNGATYPSIEEFAEGYWLDRSIMEWFADQYLRQAADAADMRASPILAPDLSGLPPTLLVTPENDGLRDMGAAFAARLAAAGVVVEYRCVAGLVHNFFGHAGKIQAARMAIDDVARWVRAALHGGV